MESIKGLKCPKCEHTESFYIKARVPILTQLGLLDWDSDCDAWPPESPCKCEKCNFIGVVADFRGEGEREATKALGVTQQADAMLAAREEQP